MTDTATLELFDRHDRMRAAYPRYRREVADKVVRMIGEDEGSHDYLIYSRLDEACADAVIDRELAYFASIGHGFEWKLYSHDSPADLKERLAARGFSIGDDETLMVLDLAELPPELASPPKLEVRKIEYPRDFADYAALNAATWPDDDPAAWLAQVEATLRDRPARLSAYVAYVDGVPACAARIDFPEDSPFASLWGGATLEPYRGRGAYTAILAARAREAIARGYRFLYLDASPMSRPIVARQGFRALAVTNPCVAPGAGA